MRIRPIKIPDSDLLERYLREAEAAVDTLDDSDLASEEAALERRIQNLLPFSSYAIVPLPRFALSNPCLSAPSKRPHTIRNWSLGGGLMVAALALYVVQLPTAQITSERVKGLGSRYSCDINFLQANRATLEIDADGRFAAGKLPVFAKTDCGEPVVLEALHDGRWESRLKLQVSEGFLVHEGRLFDARGVPGEWLRIRGKRGVSEAFRGKAE